MFSQRMAFAGYVRRRISTDERRKKTGALLIVPSVRPVRSQEFRMYPCIRLRHHVRGRELVYAYGLAYHSGMIQPRRSLRQRTIRMLAITLLSVVTAETPSMAQTTPTPANPQNPSTQSLQAGVDTSSSTLAPTTVLGTVGVTPLQGVASVRSSNRPGSLRSAGQGLPGMPGGPPIRGSLGYQDPSSSYMRPPLIGPLVCDPAVDGVCE
jgi:hypothetical protein